MAIGSADQEVSGPLRRMAAEADIPVFDPEGVPLLGHEVSWLVKTLTRLLHTGAWQAAGQLLRIPDVLALAVSAVGGTDARRLLEEWDAFQLDRLPQSLAQAAGPAEDWSERRRQAAEERALAGGRSLPPAPIRVLPRVLEWFQRLLADFKNPSLPEALTGLLERVYSGRKFSTGADRQRFVAAVIAWQEAAVSVEKGASAFLPRLSTAGRLDLAAVLVKDARLYTAHPDEARALHGWLELPWQEAPELIIAGLNEGMVPDSVLGDAWLPDSVRASLDLKTNDTRLARDSYLLTAMTASRRRSGALRLLCGRMNAAGDPLKPSRLLLRCPPAELPERALRLFPKELDDQRGRIPAPPWQRAWRLKVPPAPEDSPVLRRLNVTAFADYLKCPLRFYLRHVLKMEAFDATRAELESRAVGSLFHSAMEEFHKQPGLRDSQDEGRITEFLHDRLEERVSREYGGSLTVPVDMQLEVVRNCLARAAIIHAQESSLGWRFHRVELAFPSQVIVKGTEIRGRIDLIQHHPDLGYRILDYKTSTKAVKPVDAHLKSVSSKSEKDRLRRLPGREWALVDDGAKLHRWTNLQLPLYARIMAAHYQVDRVQVGYISLPRAVSEAGLEVWDGLDSALQTAAWACAEGVIDSVRQGLFWPPGQGLKYDDFESLVFEDTESSFDPALLHEAHNRLRALAASADPS
ncbi:MAG: PD-(D/E)XK nuclease family protein, partial [Verrucomicrobiaceae bacterium]